LVFPAPSAVFGRHRPGPSRTCRWTSPAWWRTTEPSTPVTLASPSKRPQHDRSPSRPSRRPKPPSRTWTPSSPGVRPLTVPPPTYTPRVHSRKPKLPSGRRHHPFRLVFRPRGFAPPRRLPPRGGCGFVAPRCRSWNSPRFTMPSSARSRESHRRTDIDSRDAGLVPYEDFPPSVAVPRHRDCSRSPQPFPSCRYPSTPHDDRNRRAGTLQPPKRRPMRGVPPCRRGGGWERGPVGCLADEAPVRRSGPPLRRPRRGTTEVAAVSHLALDSNQRTGTRRVAREARARRTTPPAAAVANQCVQCLSGGVADFKAFLH
jgi:hypothetical protein